LPKNFAPLVAALVGQESEGAEKAEQTVVADPVTAAYFSSSQVQHPAEASSKLKYFAQELLAVALPYFPASRMAGTAHQSKSSRKILAQSWVQGLED
jgi:hypothetical protein